MWNRSSEHSAKYRLRSGAQNSPLLCESIAYLRGRGKLAHTKQHMLVVGKGRGGRKSGRGKRKAVILAGLQEGGYKRKVVTCNGRNILLPLYSLR